MKRARGQRKIKTPRLQLRHLGTEKANSASTGLDQKSALEIVRIINREDARVAASVKRTLPQIAKAIDLIASALAAGGRLIYVGTGTSGRIGALDAVECPPTFDFDPRRIQFIIAGGSKALASAVEADEDSAELGRRAMLRKKPARKDVVVGIAASGRTPFTVAAIDCARAHGAETVAIVCNSQTPLAKAAHLAIVANVGPEVVAGSTRMKAGTAQKMILNMLSTGAMVRLGYVYGNLMVNVLPRNRKLVDRGLGILEKAARLDRAAARKMLQSAGGRVSVAMVMAKAGVKRGPAIAALRKSEGRVRQAILFAEPAAKRGGTGVRAPKLA